MIMAKNEISFFFSRLIDRSIFSSVLFEFYMILIDLIVIIFPNK